MEAVGFLESNATLRGCPADQFGTDQDVADLKVYVGGGQVISCWRATFLERLCVLVTGRVWFRCYGKSHPPILLYGHFPFVVTWSTNASDADEEAAG